MISTRWCHVVHMFDSGALARHQSAMVARLIWRTWRDRAGVFR
jgi:hypothetical protein